MNPTWQEIWNRKSPGDDAASVLAQLIDLDGFGSPFGGLRSEESWRSYLAHVAARLGIQAGDSIFEVGCGGGAFLYPFYQQGHRVAGVDYAASLVAVASRAMPGGEFHVGDAAELGADDRFDVVVSNGVFLYFPDYDYAARALRRMVRLARKSVGVFDVPDLARHDEAVRHRRVVLGEAEYERRYRGLEQLYFARDWFAETLRGEPVRVRVEDQQIEGYGNSPYRFNVFIDVSTDREGAA